MPCADGEMIRDFAIHHRRKINTQLKWSELVKWLFQSQEPLKAPDNAQIKRNTQYTAHNRQHSRPNEKEAEKKSTTHASTKSDVYYHSQNSNALSKISAIGIYCWIFCFFFSIFLFSEFLHVFFSLFLFSFAFHNKIMWSIRLWIFQLSTFNVCSFVISITVSLVICYNSKPASRVSWMGV